MGQSVSKPALHMEEESSKRALLIGVHYRYSSTQPPLEGCYNDVMITKQYLIEYFQFPEKNIDVMVDSLTAAAETQPTDENIRLALSKLVQSAKPGDILFVHFSGHGNREALKTEDDDTGYDQYIVAADDGHITDQLASKGCKITIIADCCYSGGMIEAAKEQIGKISKQSRCCDSETTNTLPSEEDNAYVSYRKSLPQSKMKIMENFEPGMSSHSDGGILLSACRHDEKAQEKLYSQEKYGVFTKAIATIIKDTGGKVTNRKLVLEASKIIHKNGTQKQNPGLYCSELHADAPFLR